MATREMKICDFCGKVLNGEPKTVVIADKSYSDVCMSCVSRMDTFVKRLGTPYVPKKKLDEVQQPETDSKEEKPPLFGKQKK